MTSQFQRNCPSCKRELFYRTKGKLKRAIENNCLCRSCAYTGRTFSPETLLKMSMVKRGKKSPLRGISISDETKRKISLSKIGNVHHSPLSRHKMSIAKKGCKAWNKGKIYSEKRRREMADCARQAMHRPDVRRRHVEALYQSQWLKVKTDRGQLELLSKWNRMGFNFIPNYAIKGSGFLYYLDGYDPIRKVVLEYDSKYHFRKSQNIRSKDLVREQNIINLLHPRKFWRYNAVEKTWKNV